MLEVGYFVLQLFHSSVRLLTQLQSPVLSLDLGQFLIEVREFFLEVGKLGLEFFFFQHVLPFKV